MDWKEKELERDRENIERLKKLLDEINKKPSHEWTDQDRITQTSYFMAQSEYKSKTHPIYGRYR